ncbi:hypothetical protein [Synechococcus sp. 1G10]|uniref:hypothetical protein n=1 Tax=Synechococcus sp. 1G10 TaxID=2025605 RepID=UPI00118170AF|nr:hypothetical protein [Synechococcus sp. 1G10]
MVLKAEGCPWAAFNEQQLYLAINARMAPMGFAFGYGQFDRQMIEVLFLPSDRSNLAKAITATAAIKPDFEVRVTAGLEQLVATAINEGCGSSWDGYAWDVFHMARSASSWEFAAGEVLYGCGITTDTTVDDMQIRWLVSGLLDPGFGKGWLTFGLAEELLATPAEIPSLTFDSISGLAFGGDELAPATEVPP